MQSLTTMVITLVAGFTFEQLKLFAQKIITRLRDEFKWTDEQVLELIGIEPIEADPMSQLAALVASNKEPVTDPDLKVEAIPVKSSVVSRLHDFAELILADMLNDAGKVWANKSHNTPVINELTGCIATFKGAFVIVLSAVDRKGYALIKSIGDNGRVHGQAKVVQVEKLNFKSHDLKVSGLFYKCKDGSRLRSDSSEQTEVKAEQDKTTDLTSVKIPNNKTHLVLVDKEGKVAQFANGGDVRLYIKGKAAQKILNGEHRNWSPRIEAGEFSIQFN